MVNNGFMNRDEARAALGFGPAHGGMMFRIPVNTSLLDGDGRVIPNPNKLSRRNRCRTMNKFASARLTIRWLVFIASPRYRTLVLRAELASVEDYIVPSRSPVPTRSSDATCLCWSPAAST